jgi:hypothetical protein
MAHWIAIGFRQFCDDRERPSPGNEGERVERGLRRRAPGVDISAFHFWGRLTRNDAPKRRASNVLILLAAAGADKFPNNGSRPERRP